MNKVKRLNDKFAYKVYRNKSIWTGKYYTCKEF